MTGRQEVLYTFEGKWDSLITIKDANGREDVLFDLAKIAIVKKHVTPIDEQSASESRKSWEAVSKALKRQDHDAATIAKNLLEESQRKVKQEREEKGIAYDTKLFHKDKNGIWRFDWTDTRPYQEGEPPKILPTEFNKRKAEREREKLGNQSNANTTTASTNVSCTDSKDSSRDSSSQASAPLSISLFQSQEPGLASSPRTSSADKSGPPQIKIIK